MLRKHAQTRFGSRFVRLSRRLPRWRGMVAIVSAILVLGLATDTALAQKHNLTVKAYSGDLVQWVYAKTSDAPEDSLFLFQNKLANVVGARWQLSSQPMPSHVLSNDFPGFLGSGEFRPPAQGKDKVISVKWKDLVPPEPLRPKGFPDPAGKKYYFRVIADQSTTKRPVLASNTVVITTGKKATTAEFTAEAQVFPDLELVAYSEQIGQVPQTQFLYGLATVKVRAVNHGATPTDPMTLSVTDFNVLMRQKGSSASVASLKPGASTEVTLKMEAVLPPPKSQLPQEQQFTEWRQQYENRCGVDLWGGMSWGGPQDQAPMNAYRKVRLYKGIGDSTPCQEGSHPPVTGPYVKELSGLDNLMVNWMNKYCFRAATLAVLKDKKLVYERGYGYQDKNLTTPILPNARMRLASVSLVLTKRALRQLVEEDKLLDPEASVYQVLNLPPWVGTYADERMKDIKIQHLLDDTSCFADGAITAAAGTSENPQKVIGKAMALGRNATLAESLKFIWSRSSTMLPSSSCTVGKGKWDDAKEEYLPQGSHFAMEVAAQIIAKTYAESSNQTLNDNDPTVVGKKYGEYINLKVGAPIEASFFQANNTPTEAWPKEIWYSSLFKTDPEWNRKWLLLPQVSAAYGIDFFARPGSGTVVDAGRDLARYLKKYWLNGKPKRGLPAKFAAYSPAHGSLPGTSAIIVDQVWSTGVSRSFVVLVNMRNETITPDTSHKEITCSI
jgi:hypothetical protein